MLCVPGPDLFGQRVGPQSLSPHDLYFRAAFFPGQHAPMCQGQLRPATRINPPRHPEPNYGGLKQFPMVAQPQE